MIFVASNGDIYCEFMYTKRMFQWEVDDYSYYSMLWTLCNNLGSLVVTPVCHWFNINDNLIILLCCGSLLSSRVIRGLAATGPIFTINIACCLSAMFWAPIR